MKKDNLEPDHLRWLIEGRAANQKSGLKLLTLIEKYTEAAQSIELLHTTQLLVGTCFSLWRAVFLADKTGTRSAVLEDAKSFLGKMLTDNAITYPQDRSAREWTFNYYANNAKSALYELSQKWKEVQLALLPRRLIKKGSTSSTRRWDRYQNAFNTALQNYEVELKAASERIKTPNKSFNPTPRPPRLRRSSRVAG